MTESKVQRSLRFPIPNGQEFALPNSAVLIDTHLSLGQAARLVEIGAYP